MFTECLHLLPYSTLDNVLSFEVKASKGKGNVVLYGNVGSQKLGALDFVPGFEDYG